MRALVAYGSKMGGTAGLAEMVAAGLRRHGVEADVLPAAEVKTIQPYDAVVIGGALYANGWHRDARRFATRNQRTLHRMPVWLFSSGPLGEAAERAADIPPVRQVAKVARAVAARGHRTFGGCLRPDAPGFMARAMANALAEDWRDAGDADRWAGEIAADLQLTARPPTPTAPA
jgi:menaquinone-dependent protoporphyrinogen oxidase